MAKRTYQGTLIKALPHGNGKRYGYIHCEELHDRGIYVDDSRCSGGEMPEVGSKVQFQAQPSSRHSLGWEAFDVQMVRQFPERSRDSQSRSRSSRCDSQGRSRSPLRDSSHWKYCKALHGQCQYGDSCFYRHAEAFDLDPRAVGDLKSIPVPDAQDVLRQLRRSEPPPDSPARFVTRLCQKCLDQSDPPCDHPYKQLCLHYDKGRCKYGEACFNIHSTDPEINDRAQKELNSVPKRRRQEVLRELRGNKEQICNPSAWVMSKCPPSSEHGDNSEQDPHLTAAPPNPVRSDAGDDPSAGSLQAVAGAPPPSPTATVDPYLGADSTAPAPRNAAPVPRTKGGMIQAKAKPKALPLPSRQQPVPEEPGPTMEEESLEEAVPMKDEGQELSPAAEVAATQEPQTSTLAESADEHVESSRAVGGEPSVLVHSHAPRTPEVLGASGCVLDVGAASAVKASPTPPVVSPPSLAQAVPGEEETQILLTPVKLEDPRFQATREPDQLTRRQGIWQQKQDVRADMESRLADDAITSHTELPDVSDFATINNFVKDKFGYEASSTEAAWVRGFLTDMKRKKWVEINDVED